MVTICTTSLTFNNPTFCPHSCIYVFCVDLRTNSDYFPIQHWLTGLYSRDGVCLLCGTDWVFIYNSGPSKAQWSLYLLPVWHSTTLRSAHTAVSICFVWIWEQTAIISLYSIDWLVCVTETECVYCAVRTGSLYIIQVNFNL